MFGRTLRDAVNRVERAADKLAVAAFVAGNQLERLVKLPKDERIDFLNAFYPSNGSDLTTLKDLIDRDQDDRHPLLFCCYALATNNINTLDMNKLTYTMEWLSARTDKNKAYTQLLNSLQAIKNVRDYTTGQKVTFPKNCYLNLSGAVLLQADLSGQDLSHANLSNANLASSNCEKTNFTRANMATINGDHAVFKEATLTNASLVGADLTAANLTKVDGVQADFAYAKLANADCTQATLTRGKFNHCDLAKTTFRRSELSNANLNNVKATQSNFVEATLKGAAMQNGVYSGADMRQANMRSASVQSADFAHANLTKADLAGISNSKTTFDHANLAGASLFNVSFGDKHGGCSLVNANLTGADLRRANLCSAQLDMRGANFSHCRFNAQTQFFYRQGRASSNDYQYYVIQKKNELSVVSFVSKTDFSSSTALDKELVRLHTMLSHNPDYERLQKCIGYDITAKTRAIMQNNPALAQQLRRAAYNNTMFEPHSLLFQAVNGATAPLRGVMFDENSRMVESDAQEQMRFAFGGI